MANQALAAEAGGGILGSLLQFANVHPAGSIIALLLPKLIGMGIGVAGTNRTAQEALKAAELERALKKWMAQEQFKIQRSGQGLQKRGQDIQQGQFAQQFGEGQRRFGKQFGLQERQQGFAEQQARPGMLSNLVQTGRRI